MWSFNRKRRLGFKDPDEEADLIEHILDNFPHHRIEPNKAGIWGVALDDQETGTTRYRKEQYDLVEGGTTQTHASKEAARERMEMLRGKLATKAPVIAPEQIVNDSEEERDAGEDDSASLPETMTMRTRSKVASGRTSQTSTIKRCRTPSPSTRVSILCAGQQHSRKRDFKASSAAGSSADGEGVQPDGADVNTEERKRRRTSAETAVETASSKLKKILLSWDWTAHYNNRSRRREFDVMISSLNTQARKCAVFFMSEDAQQLSMHIFDAIEVREDRQDTFFEMKTDFKKVALTRMDWRTRKVFLDAPQALLTVILQTEVEKLVPKAVVDEDYMKCLISVAGYHDPDSEATGMLSYGFLRDADGVHKAQKTLGKSIVEKCWKLPDSRAICLAGKLMCSQMPKLPVDIHNFDVTKLRFVDGWTPQACVDLSACVVAAEALEFADRIESCSRTFRSTCAGYVNCKDKISSHVKTLFKQVQGSHHNLGKTAWDVMSKFQGAMTSVAGNTTSAKVLVDGLSGYANALEAALESNLVRTGSAEVPTSKLFASRTLKKLSKKD